MNAGFRKAALKLHAMPAADRGWIMEQLPAPDRAALAGLLDELQALGIAPDHHIADEAAQGGEARQPVLAAAGDPAVARALDALCAAAPASIAALLADEPEQMAAVFLAAYPWPWRARLLADYEVEQRRRLNAALQAVPPLTPRVLSELVGLMARRLALLDIAVDPASAARAPARGWLRWLR